MLLYCSFFRHLQIKVMATSGLSTTKSLGPHGHWGFSAPVDIFEALKNVDNSYHAFNTHNPSSSSINILLINPGDVRHILCTVSRLRRHFASNYDRPKIRFYLLENPLEILTRELILLELFFDTEVPIRQRANVFLEVFGNLFVQKRTNSYLEILSSRLLKLLATKSGNLQQVLNFEHLSFRQIDDIEKTLRFYDRKEEFQLAKYYDHRKRGLYEDRYDNRQAVFDWDYHASLKRRASIVHIKQYKHWRETGIAFKFGDQQYSEPNKSIMSYTEGFMKTGAEKGSKKEVKGFWGDIVVSPYISFGIDCDTPNNHAEGLYDIHNKNTGTEQHRHHAVEIALYNLFSYLWEIETGQVYSMTKAHDIYSGLGTEGIVKFVNIGDDANEEELNSSTTKEEDVPVVVCSDESEPIVQLETSQPTSHADRIIADNLEDDVARLLHTSWSVFDILSSIEIIPLSGSYGSCLSKPKWKEHFHAVVVSSRCAQIVTEEYFQQIFDKSQKSLLMMETAKFLNPLNDTTKTDFMSKEIELAEKAGFSRLSATPVCRRHRDELDKEDDILFFSTVNS